MPLWQRGQSTSSEALVRTLYHEHGNALLAYATRLTGDRWTAEDVVQETLLRAWRHADVLSEANGSIRGWLFTVTRNIVTDRARMRAARPAEVTAVLDTASDTSVGDHSQRIVDSMAALDALEQLSEEHRAVVVVLYVRGLSAPEAAEVLGIPVGTVKSRAHRAMLTLRNLMSAVPTSHEVATR